MPSRKDTGQIGTMSAWSIKGVIGAHCGHPRHARDQWSDHGDTPGNGPLLSARRINAEMAHGSPVIDQRSPARSCGLCISKKRLSKKPNPLVAQFAGLLCLC